MNFVGCIISWFVSFCRIVLPTYSWVDLYLDNFTLEYEGSAFFRNVGSIH
jgi:hypothetical protein